jgi:hypothetical protein
MAFDPFESNVLFVLRFMIDCGVVGGCWCELPATKYALGGQPGRPKLSNCQIDAHVNFKYAPRPSRLAADASDGVSVHLSQ